MRSGVAPARPAGLSPALSASRLPAVWPQTIATISSATPIFGAAIAAQDTSSAPPSPPTRYHHFSGAPSRTARRARGSARVTVTSAISASSPIVLLTAAAISPEPSDRPRRPLM